MPSSGPGGEARLALSAGIACYLIWGFVPLYFQALGHMGVGPWEILAQRIVWSVPAAALFVLLARQWGQVAGLFRRPRVLAWLGVQAQRAQQAGAQEALARIRRRIDLVSNVPK